MELNVLKLLTEAEQVKNVHHEMEKTEKRRMIFLFQIGATTFSFITINFPRLLGERSVAKSVMCQSSCTEKIK